MTIKFDFDPWIKNNLRLQEVEKTKKMENAIVCKHWLRGLCKKGEDCEFLHVYALDKMPELKPHSIPTIYYMTPHQPNTVVDVSDVWDLKNEAMSVLKSQMEFSGQHFESSLSESNLESLVPGFFKLPNHYEKGRAVHKALDQAVHVYHGLATHGHYAFAEAFRREGNFHLDELLK